MFKNIGGKIKALAKVLFIISVVLCVIGAIVAGIGAGASTAMSCGSYRSGSGVAGFFAGLGTFIVTAGLGFLFAWIGSFFTYGLGQLIEDTEINRKTNQEILKKLDNGAAPAPAAPVTPPPAPQKPTTWTCPNCHTVNDEHSAFCFNCGTRKA